MPHNAGSVTAMAAAPAAWRAEETAIERHVARHEECDLVRSVAEDARRIVRLIEGGLLTEAASVAGGLLNRANRRLIQLGLLDA